MDENFPLMKGDMIGYGVPGQSSSGEYRGAWNNASGSRRQMTAFGLSSKFVYDFSPSQITQEVKKIGLTWQFTSESSSYLRSAYKPSFHPTLGGYQETKNILFDGFLYSIESGVVTKTDIITGNNTTYNISGIVGTTYNSIGINPNDGTCYVKVYNYTAANRKLYKFSDSTFSTLTATYTISTFASTVVYAFGVYGNYLYDVYGGLSIDFVNDSEFSTFTVTSDPVARAYGLGSTVSKFNMSVIDKYMFSASGSSGYANFIFDLEKGQQIGCSCVLIGNARYRIARHPLMPSNKALYHIRLDDYYATGLNPAIAIYRLPVDAPERPTGYGMTITYELEVLY